MVFEFCAIYKSKQILAETNLLYNIAKKLVNALNSQSDSHAHQFKFEQN
jgi:hypothetical protein